MDSLNNKHFIYKRLALLHALENGVRVEQPQHTHNDVAPADNLVESSSNTVDNLVHTEAEEQEGQQRQNQTLHGKGLGNALVN